VVDAFDPSEARMPVAKATAIAKRLTD